MDPRDAKKEAMKNRQFLLTFGPALGLEEQAKRASQPTIRTYQGRSTSLAQEDGSGDHVGPEKARRQTANSM